MQQGFAIKGPAGTLTCFTDTSEDSIKWHVAGYEAYIQKRAVDPERIMKGWRPQVMDGWLCVEATLLEATEHELLTQTLAYTEAWKARIESLAMALALKSQKAPGPYAGIGTYAGQAKETVDPYLVKETVETPCEHEWWTVAGDGSIECKKCGAIPTEKDEALAAEKEGAKALNEIGGATDQTPEGVLGGGQPGDPVDAEFDTAETDEKAPDTVMGDDVAEMLNAEPGEVVTAEFEQNSGITHVGEDVLGDPVDAEEEEADEAAAAQKAAETEIENR